MGGIERESDPGRDVLELYTPFASRCFLFFCNLLFFKFEFAVIKKMNLFMSFLFFVRVCVCVCWCGGVIDVCESCNR